jgi:hypothetical protein
MADEAAKIAVGLELDLSSLKAGIAQAIAQIQQATPAMVSASRQAGQQAAKALVEPYSMVGETYDLVEEKQKDLRDSFAYGIDPSIPAGFAMEMEKVNTATVKTTNEMQRMARLTANIGRGLAMMEVGLFAANIGTSLWSGNINAVDDAIKGLPLGLGKVGELLIAQRDFTFGITQEYKDNLNPAIAEQNRLLEVARQRTADQMKVQNQLSALRIQETMATDPGQRAESAFHQERITAQAEFDLAMERLRSGEDTTMNEGQIEARFLDAVGEARARLDRQRQDAHAELLKQEEQQAEREAEARWRGEAESAKLIEQNRRNERQKKYRETLEDIEREMKARQESQAIMQEQLAAARGVTGANFVTSIGTAIGSMRVGAAGGAEEVGRAQIRAANLLADIKNNTAEMAKLAGERDFVSSLR